MQAAEWFADLCTWFSYATHQMVHSNGILHQAGVLPILRAKVAVYWRGLVIICNVFSQVFYRIITAFVGIDLSVVKLQFSLIRWPSKANLVSPTQGTAPVSLVLKAGVPSHKSVAWSRLPEVIYWSLWLYLLWRERWSETMFVWWF